MAASLRSVLWRAKLFNQGHTGFATFVCLNGRSQSLNGKHSFSIIVESKIKQIEQQKSVADDVYRCKTIAQRYSTASETERNCWKCGVSNRSYEELFFCKCGIVQRLPDDITYFEMLNSAQQFDIDTGHLSQVYKDLQTRLHPDRFTLKSQVLCFNHYIQNKGYHRRSSKCMCNMSLINYHKTTFYAVMTLSVPLVL